MTQPPSALPDASGSASGDAALGPGGGDAGPGAPDPTDSGTAPPGTRDAGVASAEDAATGDATTPLPPAELADLGALPSELAGLQWPEAPRITREVTVHTADELAREVGVPGTRVHVVGAVGGSIGIGVDDVEILADDATSLGGLLVARGVSRAHVSGGAWTSVELAIPANFYPSVEYRDEWMVEDVLLEGVRVSAGDTAFAIRGRRIAIVRSVAEAARYSVWCGDTGPFQSEDVIVSGNDFRSAGAEATVRLVQVLRSATVHNRLENGTKHNYRVHGTSDLNYAARNLLVKTGVMLGRMPGDDLGRVWFDDNELHHDVPDLFNPDGGIDALHATGNVAYTNVWDCFYCAGVMPGWTVSDNVVHPYVPAP